MSLVICFEQEEYICRLSWGDSPLTARKTEYRHFCMNCMTHAVFWEAEMMQSCSGIHCSTEEQKKLQSARLSNLKSDSTRVASGFWTSNLHPTVVAQFGICLNNYFKRLFMQLSRVWLGYCSIKFVVFSFWNNLRGASALWEEAFTTLCFLLMDPLGAPNEMDQCKRHTTFLSV